jgi:hemolysin activation/secretion protein
MKSMEKGVETQLLKNSLESSAKPGDGDSKGQITTNKVAVLDQILTFDKASFEVNPLLEDYTVKGEDGVSVHFKGDISVFSSIVKVGDVDYLLQDYCVLQLNSEKLSRARIKKVVADVKEALVATGLYLVKIETKGSSISKKNVVLTIDEGRFGEMTLYEKSSNNVEDNVPYKGKYYSDSQLREKLENIKDGQLFDYYVLYGTMFDINSSPDLLIDIDLNVNKRKADGVANRYADIDVFVEDSLPLHAMLEVKNTGTDATDELRLGLTVQHLNLTKHDDVLTFSTEIAPELTKSWSVAGSYFLPFEMWKGSQSLSVYGGVSSVDSDIDYEAERLTALGDGYFVGAQLSTVVYENKNNLISAYFGGVVRRIEETLKFQGETVDLTPITVVPLNLALSYASLQPDMLYGGKTFLSLSGALNAGGSSQKNFESIRSEAEKNYFIGSVSFARLQPIVLPWYSDVNKFNGWNVFLKFDGQFTGDALIPSEQKTIGGMDTVRGYEERIFQGDNGLNATFALRTPFMTDLIGGLDDRLQFLIFFDYGWVDLVKSQIGYEDSIDIYSVGPGIRYSAGEYLSVRLDLGFPLKDVYDTYGNLITDDSCRISFRVQLQF